MRIVSIHDEWFEEYGAIHSDYDDLKIRLPGVTKSSYIVVNGRSFFPNYVSGREMVFDVEDNLKAMVNPKKDKVMVMNLSWRWSFVKLMHMDYD